MYSKSNQPPFIIHNAILLMQENKLQSSTGKENVIMWNPHRLICLSKELSSGVSGLRGGSFVGGGGGKDGQKKQSVTVEILWKNKEKCLQTQ